MEIRQCNQANPYFSVDKSNPKDFFGAGLLCQRIILAQQFLSGHIPRVILTLVMMVKIDLMMTMMMHMRVASHN